MKVRSAYSLLLFAVGAAPLQAQAHFGILVGGVSASINSKPKNEFTISTRTGFMAGGSMMVSLSNKLTFAPEAFYAQKGFQADVTTSEGVKVHFDGKLTGYEVPLLVRFSPSTAGKLKPFLMAGPTFTFSQKCKEVGTATNGTDSETLSLDCSSDATAEDAAIGSTDMGVIVGGGVKSGGASLSVRYDMGLKNIEKSPTNGSEIKNRALMLVLGYTFK